MSNIMIRGSMSEAFNRQLSRRESQIMDIVFQLGEVTANDIRARLPDPPGNSSVRVMLTILQQKGYLTHRREGVRYLYRATVAPEKAQQSALVHVVGTFFGGSVPRTVATLLTTADLSRSELDEIARLVEQAKSEEQSDDSGQD